MYTNAEISEKLTPKWDDDMSSLSNQSATDVRCLVVITSYNSATY
jgi:hypothetical protein